jgi:predicted nuclease of restriction endonuclease-like (RecB) superfamily
MFKEKSAKPVVNGQLINDACAIIEQAQEFAHHAVNETLVKRNWLLGMRIQKEVLKDERADYGKQVVKNLSCELVKRYGSGFNQANLYHFVNFFNYFPKIFYAVSRKNPVTLSWTHYRILLQECNANARSWYEQEAAREVWSTRTLQRNISSQYYHRMLKSQHKDLVHSEMMEKTAQLQDKLEFIKNPVIAEFLGFPQNTTFSESELETSIINNLQRFIMELGKGYAFVARQQHIHTEKEDYYIDLVFYNYLLKSFVLVDLKTTKVTHQDVGQMDMYVRMYDVLKR